MIKILSSNITTLQMNTIANIANASLLGGGGVDGVIHHATGPEPLEECRTFHGYRTGETRVTKGYRLPCPYIAHIPGPIRQGRNRGKCGLLESCYWSYIKLAGEYHITSTASPAISTGVYHLPLEQATRITVRTILEEKETCIGIVYLVCFDGITC